MRAALRTSLIAVAAAALLHLPAHFAPWSDAPRREPLAEDGPAFVRNEALAARPDESVVAAAVRAAGDPAAAWDGADDGAAPVRWRPVAAAALAAERAAAETPEGAAAGAALLSLLLHAAVVVATVRLVRALGGEERAALLAGLLAAASPAALSAAAWPARQPVVLATALASAGALAAIRGGAARSVASGALLALAGLAHEGAFAWALAIPFLRGARPDGSARLRDAWPAVALPVAAFAGRAVFLGGVAAPHPDPVPSSAPVPTALDGLVGMVRAAWHFAVPSRSHFADGPHAHPFAVHVAAALAVVAAALFLWPRRRAPAAAAALGAIAALAAAPAGLLLGAAAAPYQDANLYLALPLLAAAAGLALAAAARTEGRARLAAAAAGAALLAASVAATVTRAPSFRTRAAHVELARAESPQSLVVRTWTLAERASGSAAAFESAADDVGALAELAAGAEGDRLRRDPVAAATISRFLSDYAARVRVSSFPPSHAIHDAADAAAETAALLRPRSWRAWVQLAQLRRRSGALREALDAVNRAAALAPDELVVAQAGADVALAIGSARVAADVLERAIDRFRSAPGAPTPPLDVLLLYAKALAADGALSVPDPAADQGLRYRYDLAADVLESLRQTPGVPDEATRALLADVYVRYGDLLTSLDRPAMALIAYQRAIGLTGEGADTDAVRHAKWLATRLKEEGAAAEARFEEATKADPPDATRVANALVAVYVAYCRQTRWNDADAVFAKLEGDLGRVPPELRLVRAVHRHAALDEPASKASAESELRRVLAEGEGGVLPRARYELARVLEWKGGEAALREALRLHETAAREAAYEDWSLDALQRARVVVDLLASMDRGKTP